MTTTEARSSWSDWRLDGLREKVDTDFARQDEHVRELRREVNEFIRQRPSVLARWGFKSLPRQEIEKQPLALETTVGEFFPVTLHLFLYLSDVALELR